jgi:hypothetical protein
MPLPRWVAPQLPKLVEKAPTGPQWVHEIKFDGFRMAARIERGRVQLLTRSGLDWTEKYPATAAAFAKVRVKTAYIDGELCGVREDGVTSFELMQQSADAGYGGLVHFAFDLIELDGVDVARLPLLERKERLARLLKDPPFRCFVRSTARLHCLQTEFPGFPMNAQLPSAKALVPFVSVENMMRLIHHVGSRPSCANLPTGSKRTSGAGTVLTKRLAWQVIPVPG